MSKVVFESYTKDEIFYQLITCKTLSTSELSEDLGGTSQSVTTKEYRLVVGGRTEQLTATSLFTLS